MEFLCVEEIRGSLLILSGVCGAAAEDIVEIKTDGRPSRLGRLIHLHGDTAIILVFEGTRGLSPNFTSIRLMGRPLEIPLSEEILGREFDGLARPRDGQGKLFTKTSKSIENIPTNPTDRIYPRNYIHTGFSAIDGLITLIRGQKLPIFSADGLPHNQLAAKIATQANVAENEKFAVVFAAMGINHATAEFFRNSFIGSGNFDRTVMFINMSDDPPAERIATPRFALTVAEYLAYDHGYHVLVIMTDMTAYAEALREISSSRGEIPGRKGFPGYMYSDLASIYERAGIRRGKRGSVTQIPILTMPAEDITHPIPDLTGYITEGQIVLDRILHKKGIFPPINVLPSLSRLMKDGIGEGFTTKEHPAIATKLFATYAGVGDARALASVIGEEDLSENDRYLLEFGKRFEHEFLHQPRVRTMEQTLELAQSLL
ncbi:MAG: V-type ATP synthase subunit B [Defluviitaleaceae bacterium]|nr:V-type ATP synthase subunit B [Defluviitaleaceae bacterium]